MSGNLAEYVNRRIEELTAFKSETLKTLKNVTKSVDQLSLKEEEEILENKMKYYSVTGALSELEEIRRLLNNK